MLAFEVISVHVYSVNTGEDFRIFDCEQFANYATLRKCCHHFIEKNYTLRSKNELLRYQLEINA